jgi:hypothetical protein
VSGCPECCALLREFEDLDRAFAEAVGQGPAPDYLTDAVMRRLPAMPPAWRRSQNLGRWTTGLALASVQLLAVYGAYWWGFAARSTAAPGNPTRGELTAPLGGASLRGEALRPTRTASPTFSSPPTRLWSRENTHYASFNEPLTVPVRRARPTPPLGLPVLPVLQPGGALR